MLIGIFTLLGVGLLGLPEAYGEHGPFQRKLHEGWNVCDSVCELSNIVSSNKLLI